MSGINGMRVARQPINLLVSLSRTKNEDLGFDYEWI